MTSLRRWHRIARATGRKLHRDMVRLHISCARRALDRLERELDTPASLVVRMPSIKIGTCAACERPIAVGDAIVYLGRRTAICARCADGDQ